VRRMSCLSLRVFDLPTLDRAMQSTQLVPLHKE
jgi:hypothetical protein